ncbi:hypothetical protein ACEYYB_08435 [Paracoccus sp. p4-l81]|uniref:hypothetical protein n=1 Tax=Paracoccus sp. p4-l81 TaxID=3342806 RepID=UPI0035B91D65
MASAEPLAGLVPVASLWIGGALRWLDRLALHSFVQRGHGVTLYHTAAQPPEVPDGVATRPAAEVFDPTTLPGLGPAQAADLFRLHLQQATDQIWMDTDVLCLRPLVLTDGWLVGHEHGGWVNNAVLRMPNGTPALEELIATLSDPQAVPDWLPPEHQATVTAAPRHERLATACRLVPNLTGPRALTAVLPRHGDDRHALPMQALNPLPWWLGDAWFNPHGGVTGWLGTNTMVAHLYTSRLRAIHLRSRPRRGSFLSDFADEIGFSFQGA